MRGGEAVVREPLKVLAMWQPWATLVVAPALEGVDQGQPPKQFETRSWIPRSLPIRVAVHATQTMNAEILSTIGQPVFADALRRCGFYVGGDPRRFQAPGYLRAANPFGTRVMALGAIIGVADVIECMTTEDALVQMADFDEARAFEEYAFGNYGPGRYAWRLMNAALLPEPVPHTGQRKALYELPECTRELVDAQLTVVAR